MAQSRKHPLLALITRLAVILGIVGFGFFLHSMLVRLAPEMQMQDVTQARRKVQVYEPVAVRVQRTWQGFGVAEPLDEAAVPAEVAAVVQHLPDDVKVGMPVKQGQLLVRLDDRDYRDQLTRTQQAANQLQAQLDELRVQKQRLTQRLELEKQDLAISRNDLDRLTAMAARQAASSQDVDAARRQVIASQRAIVTSQEQLDRIGPQRDRLSASLQQAQAEVTQAQRNLSRCEIRSPLAGVLSMVELERGQRVAVGAVVAHVVAVRDIEVPLQLPAHAHRHIAVGDSVTLQSDDDSGAVWDASVRRLTPTQDAQRRVVTVFAHLQQDPQVIHRRLTGPGGTDQMGANALNHRGHAAGDRLDPPAQDPDPDVASALTPARTNGQTSGDAPAQRAGGAVDSARGEQASSGGSASEQGEAVLWPGMFLKGTLRTGAPGKRMIVPRRSIRQGAVLAVQPDGMVRFEPIEVAFVIQGRFPQTGLDEDQWAVIDGALPRRLVLAASAGVREGQFIEPVIIGHAQGQSPNVGPPQGEDQIDPRGDAAASSSSASSASVSPRHAGSDRAQDSAGAAP